MQTYGETRRGKEGRKRTDGSVSLSPSPSVRKGKMRLSEIVTTMSAHEQRRPEHRTHGIRWMDRGFIDKIQNQMEIMQGYNPSTSRSVQLGLASLSHEVHVYLSPYPVAAAAGAPAQTHRASGRESAVVSPRCDTHLSPSLPLEFGQNKRHRGGACKPGVTQLQNQRAPNKAAELKFPLNTAARR